MSAYEPFHVGGYVMAGNSDLMIANRVSYEYDLRGPRYVNLDVIFREWDDDDSNAPNTAWSSRLVAPPRW